MKRQKFELTGDAAKVKRDRVQRRDFNDLMYGTTRAFALLRLKARLPSHFGR